MIQLYKHIRQLIQVRDEHVERVCGREMCHLPCIDNAYLLVENGLISSYGPMSECPEINFDQVVDLSNRMVLPTWVDAHTHIVFAGHREQEFVDRINGLTYEEIATRGGGILNSAKKLELTSEAELFDASRKRIEEVIRLGTGAIEIKSGYGLSELGELKMLRVIQSLKAHFDIPIKATFLGAHAFPEKYKTSQDDYVTLICESMLPKIVHEDLADYIDVFCEKGYFNLEQTERIIQAGAKYGLRSKIHVNQFNAIGGVALGVRYNALSLDHLEELTNEDIKCLQGSSTMPVALPACSFFLSIPYTPARRLIDAGLPLALSSDYNPGSSPTGNMNFVVSTACIKMKMTPEEVINAATINAAYAMGLGEVVGSISPGKKANFIVTKEVPSLAYLPYNFGGNNIESVYINGKKQS